MSQANIDLVHRAWAAYNSGDLDAFRNCLTDDWREYGRLAETCAMTEGVGFYKQISGREPPGHVDNIG